MRAAGRARELVETWTVFVPPIEQMLAEQRGKPRWVGVENVAGDVFSIGLLRTEVRPHHRHDEIDAHAGRSARGGAMPQVAVPEDDRAGASPYGHDRIAAFARCRVATQTMAAGYED